MSAKVFRFVRNIIKIAWNKPKDLKHVFGVASWAAGEIVDPDADTRNIPSVGISGITQGSERLVMQLFPGVGASVSPMECVALATLAHKVGAGRVFEFGTYKGVSTTLLALNLVTGGKVFTLDLPEDHPAYSLPIPKAEERMIAAEKGKGTLIPGDILDQVVFLHHDSATFDESPYADSMDLVFVDGAHSYEYVKSDSEKGWRMLRKGGVLAWHDCSPNHPDVVRFIRECGWNPKLVQGTALAFAFK